MLGGLGRMFYLVNATETTYEEVKDVPNFFRNAWPYFLLFMALENVTLWLQGKSMYRLNDGLTSLSHGIIQECGRLVFRGAESCFYVYFYENYHFIELPWNNPLTWYLAAIGVDFCYYWLHRACHEVHILWAQHQVHHSSEEFNLAVGLRQSLLQGWCGFIFYLPLAVAIPPTHFIAHQQFNLLFQFWIHTKTISTLGPLEFVFNTPKHHRVHHGSNIYCLDKNYGGVLIIWDRLFGTFAEERGKIIYGLVFNQPSFNPFHLQMFYNCYVLQKLKSMSNWKLKLAAIFYGPSWVPGKPRLGLEQDKVKVVDRPKYDVTIPLWCNIYLIIHFCLVVYGFQELSICYLAMNPFVVLGFACYIIASLTSIGMLFDNNPYCCVFEVIRCALFLGMAQNINMSFRALLILNFFFLASGILWILKSVKILKVITGTKRLH